MKKIYLAIHALPTWVPTNGSAVSVNTFNDEASRDRWAEGILRTNPMNNVFYAETSGSVKIQSLPLIFTPVEK